MTATRRGSWRRSNAAPPSCCFGVHVSKATPPSHPSAAMSPLARRDHALPGSRAPLTQRPRASLAHAGTSTCFAAGALTELHGMFRAVIRRAGWPWPEYRRFQGNPPTPPDDAPASKPRDPHRAIPTALRCPQGDPSRAALVAKRGRADRPDGVAGSAFMGRVRQILVSRPKRDLAGNAAGRPRQAGSLKRPTVTQTRV